MSRALVIMAKEPKAGSTKTRLSPSLTPAQAASLYKAMLTDIVARLAGRTDATVLIAVASSQSVDWFKKSFPDTPLIVQQGKTLGERLDHVLSSTLASGYSAAFAISSDSPDLPDRYIDDAFALLDDDEVDVVLGPSEDGGYWTIGWKKPWSQMVVDVEMSRSDVLENSVQIAEELGARVAVAGEWYDIDRIEDVSRLVRGLDAEWLPATHRTLHGRFIAVIPALDEGNNIADVVTGLFDEGVDEVIVVDNGSTDDTALEAFRAGARVVTEPRRGYGYACAAGTKAALASGATVVVYIDGDQSSRPSEISDLLEPIKAGSARLVLGSRTAGTIADGAMPPHQRAGNIATAALMRLLYRVPVSDLGPYRAIDADLIDELDMTEMTFGWPTEMMVKVAAKGEAIHEVPVSWDARATGESKVGGTVIGSVLAGFHILRVTVRHALPARSR